jgi:hypothetical protein
MDKFVFLVMMYLILEEETKEEFMNGRDGEHQRFYQRE